MFSLDNKGFGLATLIIFVCVFICFLLIMAFFVSNLNKKGVTNAATVENLILKENNNK